MCDYGMSVTMALHGFLEEEKEVEAEMQKIAKLANEAHERGIIILDSRLLEAPQSEIGFPHIAMYLDADLKPFRWQNSIAYKSEQEGKGEEGEEVDGAAAKPKKNDDEGSGNEEPKGTKRARATPHRSRKQDMSKIARIEGREWDREAANASSASFAGPSRSETREVLHWFLSFLRKASLPSLYVAKDGVDFR